MCSGHAGIIYTLLNDDHLMLRIFSEALPIFNVNCQLKMLIFFCPAFIKMSAPLICLLSVSVAEHVYMACNLCFSQENKIEVRQWMREGRVN